MQLVSHYISLLESAGLSRDGLIGYTLAYQNKKCTAALKKSYLEELLPELDKHGITTLYVADGEYFKTLIGKNTKVDVYHGYVLDCAIKGYEHMKIVLGVNYQAIVYNPLIRPKLEASVATLASHLKGNYKKPGTDIIESEYYPSDPLSIKASLDKLHQYPELTCDIEAFSLKFYNCGIATISFAWDEHNGIAFTVDYVPTDPYEIELWDVKDKVFKKHTAYGKVVVNPDVRRLIKEFLTSYKGKFTYHNGGFDMKVLVYQLWMSDLADYEGMLEGIGILASKFDDTKLIAYLATNNTAKNELSLKVLSQAFAGNYAQEDIKNVLLIPLPDLLRYNLVDCLSTWFVKNKYHPIMVADEQESIYLNIFKPSVKTIMKAELCGMPIDPVKVQKAKKMLKGIVRDHVTYLRNSHIIQDFQYIQFGVMAETDNATRLEKSKTKKIKIKTWEDFKDTKFNPGSGTQVQALIYDHLGYEVIDTTKSKQPATGAKTLEKLINHAKNDEHREIFKSLIGLSKASKILTSFIPAFEQAQQLPDGSWRLYGNLVLGGTQSGRLASRDPNLQNIPSGSTYAKLIKMCFVSPPGWLFVGADYPSLEDRINTLLTRDPNKMKVYLDGFDGHCLRAFSYFGNQMADIEDTVESINSIQVKYKKLRQDSKAPTFALTYGGMWKTLMNSTGLPEAVCKQIEANYHKLYAVSDQWMKNVLDEAHRKGYIVVAFGLRLRTPVLAQTPLDGRLPYNAEVERRSAGNAAGGQSYGMLNSKAANDFMDEVEKSEFRLDILHSNQIHDASYYLVRDDVKVLKFVNDNLPKAMRWQDLPEIQHDKIGLGGEVEIFWPNWATPLELPNDIDCGEISKHATEHVQKIRSKA
jgi:DNA polymerase-1